MYGLCIDCYEVYKNAPLDEAPYICPKASCRGDVVQVDELLIPAIINLNKKGYKTTGCCSTHEFGSANKGYTAGYIWINFDNSVTSLPPTPIGFESRELHSRKKDGVLTIRLEGYKTDYSDLRSSDRLKLMFDQIFTLTEWTEGLDPLEPKTFDDLYQLIQGHKQSYFYDAGHGMFVKGSDGHECIVTWNQKPVMRITFVEDSVNHIVTVVIHLYQNRDFVTTRFLMEENINMILNLGSFHQIEDISKTIVGYRAINGILRIPSNSEEND